MASALIADDVPHRVPALDPRSLDIDVVEFAVFDAVDGRRSIADIASWVELTVEQTATTVERLVAVGAVTFRSGRAGGPVVVDAAPPGREPPESDMRVLVHDGRAIELPDATRLAMDEAFARIEELDLYELLGVHPTVDRKTIKRAYYAIAPEFHPDRYFRKFLGPYQVKMEAIFNRLTFAYDTLTDPESRVAYDAALRSIGRYDRPLPSMPPAPAPQSIPPPSVSIPTAPPMPVTPAAPAVARSEPRMPVATPAAPAATPMAPAARVAAPASTARTPVARPASPTPPAPNPAADRARRDELLQRLGTLRGGASPRPTAAPPKPGSSASMPVAPPAAPAPPAAVASTASLAPPPAAARTHASAPSARATSSAPPLRPSSSKPQVQSFLDQARAAEARGDRTAAANLYRLARTLAPDDPQIAEVAERASREAARATAGTQVRLGEEAAAERRWADAARAFLKATAGLPDDAALHHKAAHALLEAGQDLARATEMARRAVALAPQSLEARLTLAEAYLRSGMRAAARKEAESARELAPADDRVTALLARVA